MALASPTILRDGAHVFPVINVQENRTGTLDGSGEIRWSPHDGLTFRFEWFDQASATSLLQAPKEMEGRVGSHHIISSVPSWTGHLADGSEASLYGTIDERTTQTTYGTSGGSCKRLVCGQAAYASVSLHKESELAFWFDTEQTDRLYCLGLDVFPWPVDEMIYCSVGDQQRQRSRASLVLSHLPRLTLYRGSHQQNYPAWLAYKARGDAAPLWYDKVCEDVRGFLSFVIGRWTPFLWKDEFTSPDRLSRLYFGWHRQKSEANGSEQPVPLGRTTEIFQYGKDVVNQLPAMFSQFRELRTSCDLEWIASPLWYAFDGFLDDRLALACVSLERLATAHDDFMKKVAVPSQKKPFLTSKQSKALRDAIKPALRSIASEHDIPDKVLLVLERKIDNLHQTPNTDKLENVFADIGVVLTDWELEVLGNRNRCLHGRASLADANDSAAADDEVKRFDTLRTLINRAVLMLLRYSGPYVDYADRPAKGNFPIKSMSPAIG